MLTVSSLCISLLCYQTKTVCTNKGSFRNIFKRQLIIWWYFWLIPQKFGKHSESPIEPPGLDETPNCHIWVALCHPVKSYCTTSPYCTVVYSTVMHSQPRLWLYIISLFASWFSVSSVQKYSAFLSFYSPPAIDISMTYAVCQWYCMSLICLWQNDFQRPDWILCVHF